MHVNLVKNNNTARDSDFKVIFLQGEEQDKYEYFKDYRGKDYDQ